MHEGKDLNIAAITIYNGDGGPEVHSESLSNESDQHTPVGPQAGVVFDAGREAWMTVLGAWMIQFCTYGYSSAFGVYQDYYSREFLSQEPPSNISWIGSFQLFMQYAPGILVGRAFDAGYLHHMIAFGSFIQVVSMFMLSLTHQHDYYQIFLAQAVGMGIGQSLLFLPSLAVIGHHFQRRRSLAIGVATSGASFGGVVWPIMLNELRERTSFSNGIRATAALVGLMLVFANFCMKSKRTWVSVIQKPDYQVIFRDPPYLLSIVSAFCVNVGLFFPYFYLQLYAIEKGFNKHLAFYSVTIINAGGVLGRLLSNFFADKLGAYNMLLPCLFISSTLAFAMLSISNAMGVVIFGLLYGFWSGSYVSLIPSLLAQLSTHKSEYGTRMGVAFSIVGTSLLVGTPIEGALLHKEGDSGELYWNRSIIFCGVMVLCGALGMTLSRTVFLAQGRASGRGQHI